MMIGLGTSEGHYVKDAHARLGKDNVISTLILNNPSLIPLKLIGAGIKREWDNIPKPKTTDQKFQITMGTSCWVSSFQAFF
jgi:hypothetical protein